MNAVSWPGLRLFVAARRRLLAAALAGLAVLFGLSAVRPAPPPSVLVLAAARDLVPGVPLALPDLRTVPLPVAVVPAGALRPGAAVLGRVVAGPVRAGEPLTDVRLVGPSLLASVPEAVAVPVRFADPGAVALLHPGDRIDVLASAPADPLTHTAAPPAAARVVAANVLVLAVPPPETSGDGALGVVACLPGVARALAATTERLSPALLPPAPPPTAAPAAPAAAARGAPPSAPPGAPAPGAPP
ncbi:MAG TPA: SAF domain-containing protein [Frankiaceae bacterium]|nr:SAF domain-containing protein [Frankiaceae bacterium]